MSHDVNTTASEQESPSTLAELAVKDSLTGVSNRRHFKRTLGMLLEKKHHVYVMILDLDRFKSVNDTLGHPVGDQLLRKVTDRLRSVIGANDFLARLGGDEFSIISKSCEKEAVEHTASRIIEMLERPFLIDGQQVNVGTSVGITSAVADSTYEQTMKHADLALYAAKEFGGGAYRFFHQGLADMAQARRKMELDLRRALPLRQLEVHYRPRVDVDTGQMLGLRAVLFWRRPQHGLLPAQDFLPLAAQIGLVPKIGRWLLERACQDTMKFAPGQIVSVEVSPTQFSERERLIDAVQAALTSSTLPGGFLEIEVTETLLLAEEDALLRQLHAIRALGVRVVMNDFGVGYASLTKLTSFPFDGIKIAPTFAAEDGTLASRAIVHAVATLGASLGVVTQIEGIYSKEQLAQFRSAGAAPVQGCRLDTPRPPSELPSSFQQS